jgi:NAD(P)-dependent dehydrogenase (short-subunit alcohol dehydrogenase family)
VAAPRSGPRTVLITGAGSGVGAAAVVEAARLGFRVFAAVHRPEQVADVQAEAGDAGVADSVEAAVLDVADDAATADLVERAEPWAVVECAGYTNSGLIEDVSVEEARHQLDVMLVAPARLVQLALPGFRRRGGGRIVVVSSPVGDAGLPLQGWYTATRTALSALCDALRVEVVDDAVDVVLVEPGAVRTPLWEKSRAQLEARRARSVRPDLYDRGIAAVDAVRARAADPSQVAEVIGDALHAAHPPFRYRAPRAGVPFTAAARLLPTSVRDRLVRSGLGT